MQKAGRLPVQFPIRLLDFFNLPNTSSRTMILWPLTEINTKNLLGVQSAAGAYDFAIRESLNISQAYGPHSLLQRKLYLLLCILQEINLHNDRCGKFIFFNLIGGSIRLSSESKSLATFV
jgi:hypothetical protein